MPNYLKIQADVDKKLRQNGTLFELDLNKAGTYNPTTGESNRETATIKVYGLKVVSKIPDALAFKIKYGDYLLIMSAIDEDGDQYEPPSKGSKISFRGIESEIVDSVVELNFTGIPVLYKFILKGL